MSEYMLPPDDEKLDALFSAVEKIDSIIEDLHNSVFMYMPSCSDFNEQQKLDRLFVSSSGMDGILTLDRLLRDAKNVAMNTVHQIEHSTQAQVAY